MTTREPEYDDEDRQILIAGMDADAATCHRGHPIPETLKLAPKDQPLGYAPPRFVGKTLICLQCEFEADYASGWDHADKVDVERWEKSHKSEPMPSHAYRGGHPASRIIGSDRIDD